MITLSAHALVVTLDETLGGEIRQIDVGAEPLLAHYDWAAPIGASRSRSYGDAKLDWLSEYRGGWQLLVPNAGAACVVDGVPLPFHGEWSRSRVDVVQRSPSEVTVRAGTRLPFIVQRTVVVLGDPARVRVTTVVQNTIDRSQPFLWGEHPAFLAGPGDRIDLPDGPVFERDAEHDPPSAWPADPSGGSRLDEVPATRPLESVHYLPNRPAGWAALRRPHLGVGLAWDIADFAHLWLWRELGSTGFPFFGRTSIVAIEPASSWPGDGLAAAVDRGQALWLAGGEQRSTSMTIVPFRPSGRAVTNVEHDGTIRFEDDR